MFSFSLSGLVVGVIELELEISMSEFESSEPQAINNKISIYK